MDLFEDRIRNLVDFLRSTNRRHVSIDLAHESKSFLAVVVELNELLRRRYGSDDGAWFNWFQDLTAAFPHRLTAIKRVAVQVLGKRAHSLSEAHPAFTARGGSQQDVRGTPQSIGQRFVGRTVELTRLRRLLQPQEPRGPRVVLTGVGGGGKSRLAVEYVRSARAWPVVLWVTVGRRSPQEWWGAIGALLGISVPIHGDLALEAWLWVRNRVGCLLVLDDVVDDLPEYFESAGAQRLTLSSGAAVLATTRRPGLRGFDPVSVAYLTEEDGLQLLTRNVGRPVPGLVPLVNALHGHPLLLTHAATWLSDSHASGADELQADVYEQLARVDVQRHDLERRTIDACFRISLERLKSQPQFQLTKSVLGVVACMAPETPLKLAQLAAVLPGESEADIGFAVTRLVNTSLMERDEHTQLLRVRAVIRDWAYALFHARWAPTVGNAIARVLDQALNGAPEGQADVLNLWAPHAARYGQEESVQSAVGRLAWNVGGPGQFGGVVTKAPSSSRPVGVRPVRLAASAYGSLVRLRRERLGPTHPDTMGAMHHLALCLWALGVYREARDIQRELVDHLIETRGEDDLKTLIEQQNLAVTLQSMNDPDAVELHMSVMNMRIKLLGEDHPDTLTSMSNLAVVLPDQERSLEMNQRVLALTTDPLDRLTSMNNIATNYWHLARYAEARVILDKVYEQRALLQGQEHLDTLMTANNLGAVRAIQGEWRQALVLHLQTLVRRRRQLGDGHRHTLTSRFAVGKTLYLSGKVHEAAGYLQGVHADQVACLGASDPDTLKTFALLREMDD